MLFCHFLVKATAKMKSEMEECQENFDNDYKKNNLAVQRSPGEGDFDLLPSSKQGKTAELTFTERCVEWYKKQTQNPEDPPAKVMNLFRLELKDIQCTPLRVLDLGFFHNMALTTAFVEFLAVMEEESRSSK
jgi:hypothetical protein